MIQLHDVHKCFGQRVVLNGVSLEIPDLGNLCLVGRSGSGKSVLARLILGLEQPDSGSIFVNGQSVLGLRATDRHRVYDQFGVVFQGNALFDSLTTRENVGLKLDESGIDNDTVTARVLETLQQVGLDETVLDKYPEQLSGGMQKRVGIARAVIHQPRYLIYDEPTTGLDPINAGRIDELITSLSAHAPQSNLIITHDLQLVKHVADQVAFLHEGLIHFSGNPDAFFGHSDSLIRDFLARDLG